jgi:hypothetical protein
LRKNLNAQAPVPAKVATAKASLPSNPEALRFYSDGLQKLRSYDALGARDSLQQVLLLEPNFGLAHGGWPTVPRGTGLHSSTIETRGVPNPSVCEGFGF